MRSRQGKQPRGEVVVRRIFSVTLEQLARVGLGRLSVPEVARLAGVNKTSVYRRWPTRDALVAAALDASMEHARDVPDTGSLAGDLAVLIGRVVEFVESPRGGALLRTLFADQHDAGLQALARSAWQQAAGESPLAIGARAVARGELSPSADFELFMFAAAGAVLHRLFVERAAADEAWVERLLALLLPGVTARPGAGLPSSARGRSRSGRARATRRGRRAPRKA
jgi:AcrR family transcriptional regulator